MSPGPTSYSPCTDCHRWAKFAANNAVDAISLVLSTDPAKRSPASFSHTFRTQGLEQGVPLGSFGASKENHDQHIRKPEEEQSLQEYAQRQELVSKGSRLEALDSATDEILKAAKKLEREVRRETKYWQEIVSISDKGWPIQRWRQNARNVPFAVRYGLPEGTLAPHHYVPCSNTLTASSHFKARGLAPLSMDKDGSIMLVPALVQKPKTLRVRVSQNGNITGTSRLPVEPNEDNIAIERSIQLARDSLFEEELYHEMIIESRQLLAYGVKYRDSVIHVDASSRNGQQSPRKLLIDLIPREDSTVGNQDQANDWLAKNVADGLRLLLAHEHSMRLHRRSQLPPPLTGQTREKPPPALLRPLLAVFKHLEGVDSLYAYLETVAKTLESAGLSIHLETTREISWARLADSLKVSSKETISASDKLLEMFSKPFDGKATLTLPSVSGGVQVENLTISTRTVIGQPTFGTEHKLTLPSSLLADLGLFQHLKFSSVEETTSYLDWVLSLHIAHRQLTREFSSRAIIKGNDSRVTIGSKGSKKAPATEYDILIELQNGELKATALDVSPQELLEDAQQSHTWNGKGGETSLIAMIRSWVG
jgi:mediator of RNA polymerase II transcription subunit 17